VVKKVKKDGIYFRGAWVSNDGRKFDYLFRGSHRFKGALNGEMMDIFDQAVEEMKKESVWSISGVSAILIMCVPDGDRWHWEVIPAYSLYEGSHSDKGGMLALPLT